LFKINGTKVIKITDLKIKVPIVLTEKICIGGNAYKVINGIFHEGKNIDN